MRSIKRWQRLATLGALAGITLSTTPIHAAPWDGKRGEFVSPRFAQVWRDADLAVQQGTTGRSWTWGPKPWFDYQEVYQQGQNGMRQVQYFDKARMEINNPDITSGPLGGVTNGLLTVEMVSGRIKYGDGTGVDQNAQSVAAEIQVAGNIGPDADPLTPTYATFAPFSTTDNPYRDPNKVGQRAGTMLTATGGTSFRSDFAAQPGTEYVVYEGVTGHNIPRVFENFRNNGPVSAIAAFGYPISDPYWVQARVGAEVKDVLVQLYERRTLTYTPANPTAFQVEMGNVGQHYFQWRYGQQTPWVSPDPELPVVFASKRTSTTFNVFTQNANASDATVFYNAPGVQMIPSSIRRQWSNTPLEVFGDFVNAQNKRQTMYLTSISRQPQPLSDPNVNTYEPVVSPDGRSFLFVSDRDGNPEIFLSTTTSLADYGKQLTTTTNCQNGHPSWLPNGSGFVYASTCGDGNWNIYAAYLSYRVIVSDLGTVPEGIVRGSARLTSAPGQDRMPRVSPDGSRVAFVSDRDGNTNIYTINLDGSGESRRTNDPSRDEGPAWSPDGRRIAFNSNRDGDFEIFIMADTGSGVRQLTTNTIDDGYAVWGN